MGKAARLSRIEDVNRPVRRPGLVRILAVELGEEHEGSRSSGDQWPGQLGCYRSYSAICRGTGTGPALALILRVQSGKE